MSRYELLFIINKSYRHWTSGFGSFSSSRSLIICRSGPNSRSIRTKYNWECSYVASGTFLRYFIRHSRWASTRRYLCYLIYLLFQFTPTPLYVERNKISLAILYEPLQVPKHGAIVSFSLPIYRTIRIQPSRSWTGEAVV